MPHHRRRDTAPAQLVRQTHIATLRSHTKLSNKDQRIIALESDKVSKDGQMSAMDTRVTTLESSSSSGGLVDGGRANLNAVEASAINGGNASLT